MIARAFLVVIVFIGCFLTACNETGKDTSKINLDNGKRVYETYCQSCHMEDGSGVPNLNAPLTGSAYVKGDHAKLIEIVLKGSEALKGETSRSYRNVMASMAQLSDNQIADVLTYIRAGFGNNASELSADEVKAVREKLN